MNSESYNILLNTINKEFREFKELCNKKEEKEKEEEELEYDTTKIHRIKPEEFEQEGYFMIICAQMMYADIDERYIEIWKVYKTDKYYHVLEFDQPMINLLGNISDLSYNFNIYSYYDYNRYDRTEEYLWRNSTEILGIKLPDNFKL